MAQESLFTYAHQGLWRVQLEHRTNRLVLPLATNIVKLADGTLAVYAPGPLTPALVQALAALGQVAALIAPNLFHHLYLQAWRKQYPNAKLYAPCALEQKQPTLREHITDISCLPKAWETVLGWQKIEGMPKMQETAMFHRPTQSLLLCDALFNVSHTPSLLTRILFTLTGALGEQGRCSRLFRWMVKDKLSCAHSLDTILQWPIERIMMAHGDILTYQPKRRLAELWAPLMQAAAQET